MNWRHCTWQCVYASSFCSPTCSMSVLSIMGLILDIISIPWKYNLYQVLTDDLESGYFPNKSQVKTSVESFMISFHSVCLAILILLNSTSFVHANHLSMCEKFLIIIKLFCVNVAVDPPRYPTRILLPLSKICYERIRAFYYSLPWNTIVSQYLVGTSLRTTTSHYQDRHKVICICFSRR